MLILGTLSIVAILKDSNSNSKYQFDVFGNLKIPNIFSSNVVILGLVIPNLQIKVSTNSK